MPYGDIGTTASVNNLNELNTLWNKLIQGGTAPVVKAYGIEVTLVDGTTVTLRNSSKAGDVTIDINYRGSLGKVPNGSNFKVHINH